MRSSAFQPETGSDLEEFPPRTTNRTIGYLISIDPVLFFFPRPARLIDWPSDLLISIHEQFSKKNRLERSKRIGNGRGRVLRRLTGYPTRNSKWYQSAGCVFLTKKNINPRWLGAIILNPKFQIPKRNTREDVGELSFES